MIGSSWEIGHMLVAALASLVGVPLGVITFYLRSIHETQTHRHAELVRRFERIERLAGDMAKTVAGFALDFTTKEEWLRECMYTRARIERLTEQSFASPPPPLVSRRSAVAEGDTGGSRRTSPNPTQAKVNKE